MNKTLPAVMTAIVAVILTANLNMARENRLGKDAASVLILADEQAPMKPLAAFLEKNGGLETKCIDQGDLVEELSAHKAVFMYIHGAMTSRTEKMLIEYALGGGRLIILHHGIASARLNNPRWLQLTGIHITPREHPERPWRVVGNTTHTVVNLQPGHYITTHNVAYDRTVRYTSSDGPAIEATFEAIDLPHTEVFLNQHFTDGRQKTVLLGFKCSDVETGKTYMQDRCAWYKPAGKGYVFYFQPGHTAKDFQNKNYAQMILNAINFKPRARPANLLRSTRLRRIL